MRMNRIILLFVLTLCFFCANLSAQELGEQFAAETDAHYPYLVYLPKAYSETTETYPLIFFLHGAGERGSDLDVVKKHGPPKIVNSARIYSRISLGKELGDFNFIVISPQCPSGEWWLNEHLQEVMDEVLGSYRIDRSRMYMTGLSMGGFGTWSYASQHPELFAAIAPISGGGDALHWTGLRNYTQLDVPPAEIENLTDLPIWVFHGDSDSTVSIEEDQKTVDALEELGVTVEFTVYPNVGHDAWTQTYNNPELYQWFLSHTKQDSSSSIKNWEKSE